MAVSIQEAFEKSLAVLNSAGPSSAEAQTSKAWSIAAAYLKPRPHRNADHVQEPDPAVTQALADLRAVKVTDKLLALLLNQVETSFRLVREDLQPLCEAWREEQQIGTALEFLDRLYNWYMCWQAPLLKAGGGSLQTAMYHDRFTTCLDFSLPPEFATMMLSILAQLFALAADQDIQKEVYSPAHTIFKQLHQLELLSRYRTLLFRYTNDVIEAKVSQECSMDWSSSQLDRLQFWLDHHVKLWLRQLLAPEATVAEDNNIPGSEAHSVLQELNRSFLKFDFHLYKTLCDLRIQEFFDIIVEWPDSMYAVEDLKICLARTDDRLLLANSLRQTIIARLLHPGASTSNILTIYINTIRTLKILDPPGVLLSRVADPIRSYLRSRDDTIREIMTNLIEDGGDLVEELQADTSVNLDASNPEVEDYSDRNWMPDPMDAPPDFHLLNKKSDIIQMLVSIYDSKDVLIKEFQVLLAESLLSIKDYDAERQIRNVEILKKRFGDASLQVCEVMLKDMADSKRIDANVHASAVSNPIHPTIISKLFWPTLQTGGELKLHGQMAALQDSYQQQFTAFKPDKRLQWINSLGTVDIEVELGDRTYELQVTPAQAAVAELFAEKDTWTFEDLAKELRTDGDPTFARNALYYWSNVGLVQEIEEGVWRLLEQGLGSSTASSVSQQGLLDDMPGPFTSTEDQEIEQMRMFWVYIKTMLTNLRIMTSQKMHQSLQKSVPFYQGRRQEQLEALLDKFRTEGLVDVAGPGLWKLAPS